jgi:hypothetical protein
LRVSAVRAARAYDLVGRPTREWVDTGHDGGAEDDLRRDSSSTAAGGIRPLVPNGFRGPRIDGESSIAAQVRQRADIFAPA